MISSLNSQSRLYFRGYVESSTHKAGFGNAMYRTNATFAWGLGVDETSCMGLGFISYLAFGADTLILRPRGKEPDLNLAHPGASFVHKGALMGCKNLSRC